jgi:hypothetical protein
VELAEPDPSPDPVIEWYKVDVDRTLIRENLRKTHEERLLTLQRMLGLVDELRAAGEAARRAP